MKDTPLLSLAARAANARPALLAFVAACGAADLPPERAFAEEIRTIGQHQEPPTDDPSLGCSSILCGENGESSGFPFWSLDWTNKEPSGPEQLVIEDFTSGGGDPLQLSVAGFQLRGYDPKTSLWRSGKMLEHSVLRIKSLVTSKIYEVFIDHWSQVTPYFEEGYTAPLVETLLMSVREGGEGAITNPPRPLCPKPIGSNDPMFGATPQYEAIVFQGDRYDPATGAVVATGAETGGAFTIACAGSWPAKLVVMRYTEASSNDTHPTTPEQRTAAVFMLRADYCGNGAANTVTGTKLDWENAGGWNVLEKVPHVFDVESRWSSAGALCLSNQRIPGPVKGGCPAKPPCFPVGYLGGQWKKGSAELISRIP